MQRGGIYFHYVLHKVSISCRYYHSPDAKLLSFYFQSLEGHFRGYFCRFSVNSVLKSLFSTLTHTQVSPAKPIYDMKFSIIHFS